MERLTFAGISPGDRVTALFPSGIGRHGVELKERTGRVVFAFASHITLNLGGKYGIPGVVNDPARIVKVVRGKGGVSIP